jgi:hypothetical protein
VDGALAPPFVSPRRVVAPPEAGARCRICAAALAGPYCQSCGQPSTAARRTLREVLAGQNGRLWHTLRIILTRPGELACEIDEGRDRLSMRPLTLLFHLAALFFLASTFTGFGIEAMVRADPSGSFGTMVRQHAASGLVDTILYRERLERHFQAIYTVLIPAIALAYGGTMGLLHWKRKPWIVPLVAGIQYLCFVYIFFAVAWTLARVAGINPYGLSPMQLVSISVGVIYAALSHRRIYREGWGSAAWKGVVVVAAGLVVHNLMLVATFYIALLAT